MITIVGSGVAGFSLVRAIRKLNQEISIRVITADSGDYYYKPNLSTAIQKKQSPQDLVMYPAKVWADQYHVELVANTMIEKIFPEEKKLYSQDKHYVYEKLVIATGAKPVFPPFQGSGVRDVCHVNSLQDFSFWHKKLVTAKRVAIIGAGLVGVEFANDLIQGGFDVTVVAPEKTPLALLAPAAIGQRLESELAKFGVKWRLGVGVSKINKEEQFKIILSDDSVLEADLVLAATGLRSNASFLDGKVEMIAHGINTNLHGQSSDPDIFALGDVAVFENFSRKYVMPATFTANALAKTLLGEPTPIEFPVMPVLVKTTLYPLVSCLADGEDSQNPASLQKDEQGLTALYQNKEGCLTGFVLAGGHTKSRSVWAKKVGEHV